MTDPLTYLDEVDARTAAATEGQWIEANGMVMHSTFYGLAPVTGNAEFIAHARQDLPALSKALRAVLEALAGHPECDVHPDDDPVTCGWKAAVIDVRNAIHAALAVNDEEGK